VSLITPTEDLRQLSFLAKIRDQQGYDLLSDGPYLVGHIAEKSRPAFAGLALGREYYRKKKDETLLDDGRRTIFQENLCAAISRLDLEIGFSPEGRRFYVSWSLNKPRVNMSQRSTCMWHQDFGGRMAWPNFNRSYIVASTDGTLFIRESITRAKPDWFDLNLGLQSQITNSARERGLLLKGEDYGIYLVPIETWHCSPFSVDGAPRVFLRLLFETFLDE
jgi:hypothetical protein